MDWTGHATLAEIRTQAKQRADMVNSQFVTDAEWLAYINGSAAELYDLLIQKYGDNYEDATPYTFTADGVLDRFPLPNGIGAEPAFYKLLGVDMQATGTTTGWMTLRPFTLSERNRVGILGVTAGARGVVPRYRLSGDDLWLNPKPVSGQVFRIFYAKRFLPLEDDEDELDGVSGWEELVIVDAARKALLKEESDTSGLEREKLALLARIEAAAENRDPGSAATVADVRPRGFGTLEWEP